MLLFVTKNIRELPVTFRGKYCKMKIECLYPLLQMREHFYTYVVLPNVEICQEIRETGIKKKKKLFQTLNLRICTIS